jgi:drug/metabolite transporter (DMT)-like permease
MMVQLIGANPEIHMQTNFHDTMSTKIWLMLIGLSILWGGSFFFVGVAVNELPPLVIVTLRVGIAAMTLWVVAYAMALRAPTSFRVWGAFFAMGLLNNVLLVTLLVPVSAILLGWLFLDESLKGVHFLGMLIIALGLSVIDGRLWKRG